MPTPPAPRVGYSGVSASKCEVGKAKYRLTLHATSAGNKSVVAGQYSFRGVTLTLEMQGRRQRSHARRQPAPKVIEVVETEEPEVKRSQYMRGLRYLFIAADKQLEQLKLSSSR